MMRKRLRSDGSGCKKDEMIIGCCVRNSWKCFGSRADDTTEGLPISKIFHFQGSVFISRSRFRQEHESSCAAVTENCGEQSVIVFSGKSDIFLGSSSKKTATGPACISSPSISSIRANSQKKHHTEIVRRAPRNVQIFASVSAISDSSEREYLVREVHASASLREMQFC